MNPLWLLKAIGGPGSIGFLVASIIGTLLLIRVRPRWRSVACVSLALLCSAYVLLGLPLVAGTIAAPFRDSLAGRRPLVHGIDTLVVFDGDNRRGRLDEAVRLWALAHPAEVIVSGERWLVQHLAAAGIPRTHLVHEAASPTTAAQISYVESYTTDHPGRHVAIVASRLQMPRVMALARGAGVDADFYAGRVDRELPASGPGLFVPTYAALRVSRDALYERAALVYYAWRGWIAVPGGPMLARAQ